MTSWFGPRNPKTAPVAQDQLEAYREGRQDERQRTDPPDAKVRRGDIDDAYAKGRHDERRRRRGSPLLSFIVLIIVAAAALDCCFIWPSRMAHFSSGGAVVDNSISSASERVQAPVRNAADKAGNALENAGQNLKQRVGDQPASS